MKQTRTPIKTISLALIFSAGMCLHSGYASAGLTDLANTPVANSSSTQIPPNILFVLDNSGSMAWAHMTDRAKGWRWDVGYKNHLCNGLYYNPDKTYDLPVNSDGNPFSGTQLKAWPNAWNNGFSGSSSVVNISTSFRAFDVTTGDGDSGELDAAQPAYYYKWTGTVVADYDGKGDLDGDGNNDCNDDSSDGFPHTTGNWEKVRLTSESAEQQQNFSNWYSFYRTRMLLMKTASGRAFTALDDHFRVGFITICPGPSCTSVEPGKFLPIAAFDATQKSNWYTKFYAQTGSSHTPLRQALSRAGRYYAHVTDGINTGITDDPIQYSCQKNFTILTTDGNWNDGAGVKLDGSTMDNQDSDLAFSPRPMYDGGAVGSVQTTTTVRKRTDAGSMNCPGSPKPQRVRIQERIETLTTWQDGTTSSTDTGFVTQSTSQSCVPGSTVFPPDETLSINVTTDSVQQGGQGNTLADVAEYYYRTDLRADESIGALGTDVGTGGAGKDVPSSGSGVEDDNAPHQHMTTFTLGLGVSGHLKFDPFYKTATSGIFQEIRNGTKGWPRTNPTNTTGSSSDQLARIDDLWHAAVNGRGTAFSAGDADTLQVSLQTALASIQAVVGSAAAAATSTLTPTVTNNLFFGPLYTTGKWTGDIEARPFDINTKTVGNVVWTAAAAVDGSVKNACDNRVIKLFRSGATDNLVDFTWNTQKCDALGNPTGTESDGLNTDEQAYFGATQVAQLSHAPLMTNGSGSTANQVAAAHGANLVNFLRGHRGLEGFVPNDLTRLYRARESVLGDMVHSQPVFVAGSDLQYPDNDYATHKSTTATRTPMVYVGANDGMLHAFTAGTYASGFADGGVEKWAFIPSAVLPRLHKLADNNWSSLHEYFVDLQPVVGDIFDGSDWKTILVGGLRKGGRAYYALDITDPENPKGLWEFKHDSSFCYAGSGTHTKDCHLGYTFGLPIIAKLQNGTWVVIVTSGYNNVNSPAQAGDGQGYVYVLNAATGAILKKIETPAGDATTPSGLSNLRDWTTADDPTIDPTISVVYGADLLGNIFRFDVNSASPTAFHITTLTDGTNPQPITTRLGLGQIGTSEPYIFVATGRYLGSTDLSDTQVQSVYAIKDKGDVFIADPRADLVKLKINNQGSERTIECLSNCTSQEGWFVDLPDTGERVNIDPQLQLGILIVASSVPKATACTPGGYGWLNFFDLESGLAPGGPGETMGYYQDAMLVGITVVDGDKDGDGVGDGDATIVTRDTTGNMEGRPPPTLTGGGNDRVTWREIAQ